MFENQELSKAKPNQHHNFPPFSLVSPNTALRGHIKQIGKYQFSFDQKLGSGLTSDAYIGIEKQTHKLVCVKIIDRETFKSEKQKALLSNEISCQKKLQSEYVVKIYDVYDTNSFCFDGDLFKLVQFSRVGLPEQLVVRFACNLAQALVKMKQSKIIHRDIKSENIMLKNGVAKLGDFGFAIEQGNLKQRQEFSIGSPLYMPLESLEQNKYSYQSDIFSLGVVLYEMLHAQSPWQCSDQRELILKIRNQKIVYKSGISEKLQNIIGSCLEIEAEKRAKIETVAQKLNELREEAYKFDCIPINVTEAEITI